MAAPSPERVTERLGETLSALGFELHPFKVGWYNAVLAAPWRLEHPEDRLAVLVLSTPSMFEEAFLPFLGRGGCHKVTDPIDQCVKHCVTSAVSQCFPGQTVDVRFDYELLPNRKPRFLAQTAAHVSGAAFYYQQSDVADQPWAQRKMCGVCVHPRFGGWFAIRALLVFGDVSVGPDVAPPRPADCVPTREERIRLLEAFNFRWQDWSYRNIIPPVQTYSQRQRDYFSALPAQRFDLLRGWGLLLHEDQRTPEGTTDAQMNGHG